MDQATQRMISGVIGLSILAGCGRDRSASTTLPAAATPPAPSTQPLPNAAASAGLIDSIIYSSLPKDQMLEKLKPLVAVMDSKDVFTKKTGLQFGSGFGSGPGVMDYSVEGCGLSLVVDPDQKIRIIRRNEKSVGGVDYPQMSISEPGFNWN
jgi:hypothetical protein